MHQTLRVVAPFDSKIGRTLHRQRRCTLQQEEKEVQLIKGIGIELPFEEKEMTENVINRRDLRDFVLSGRQGS